MDSKDKSDKKKKTEKRPRSPKLWSKELQIKPKNTNPGRRERGGRIFDDTLGILCHACKQKTVDEHVLCSHCLISFCEGCLRVRHGEIVNLEKAFGKWVCPKCRGGCGPPCKNCCHCGACRKSQGLEPTGNIKAVVNAAGFTNSHDYLIHLKTGETPEKISQRKLGRAWCVTNMIPKKDEQSSFQSDTPSKSTPKSTGLSKSFGNGSNVDKRRDLKSPTYNNNKKMNPLEDVSISQRSNLKSRPESLGSLLRDRVSVFEKLARVKEETRADILEEKGLSKKTNSSHVIANNRSVSVSIKEEVQSDPNIDGYPRSKCFIQSKSSVLCSEASASNVLHPENRSSLSTAGCLFKKEKKVDDRLEGFVSSDEKDTRNDLNRPIRNVDSIIREEKNQIEDRNDKTSQHSDSFDNERDIEVTVPRETINIEDDEEEDSVSSQEIKPVRNKVNATEKSSRFGLPTGILNAEAFKENLEIILGKPYNLEQLTEMWNAFNERKPLFRLRETRQGLSWCPLQKNGASYYDLYPDLAEKLSSVTLPEERLRLLRGFFFWLQHASTSGIFQPWKKPRSLHIDDDDNVDDCIEIDGPECKIVAEVQPLDDENSAENSNASGDSMIQKNNLSAIESTAEVKVKEEPGIAHRKSKPQLLSPKNEVEDGVKPFSDKRIH